MNEAIFYISMLVFCSISLGFCLGFLCFKAINWHKVAEWWKEQVIAK